VPRRRNVLVIGSGPIVIGQAAEFDYAGVQACRALRDEGHRVVLVNSNPATIMTDEEVADAVYLEPLTATSLEAIIARERPDALLPTLGGQTGLNLAVDLYESGAIERYGVELLGTPLQTIIDGVTEEAGSRSISELEHERDTMLLDLLATRARGEREAETAAARVVQGNA